MQFGQASNRSEKCPRFRLANGGSVQRSSAIQGSSTQKSPDSQRRLVMPLRREEAKHTKRNPTNLQKETKETKIREPLRSLRCLLFETAEHLPPNIIIKLQSSGEVRGTRQEVAAAFSGGFQFSICRRVPPCS